MHCCAAISRCTLLGVAILPRTVLALGLQQPPSSREFLRRGLVTLEGCPEHKEFATPYNEDNNGYLFSGMYVYPTKIVIVCVYYTFRCFSEYVP